MRVLVVERIAPTVDAGDGLVDDLQRHGYEVDRAETGAQALDSHGCAELILLDPDLPDLDGLEVCRGIRKRCETPIIMVTCRASELDRVLGLQAGSDDYVIRPYGLRELLARIEAVMRRVRRVGGPRVVEHGALRIDHTTREVWVSGRSVDLTRKEFDFLSLLAEEPAVVVPRRRVLAEVWDYDTPDVHSSRTVDTHVSSLRAKLGARDWIVTVRGIGFRLGSR